MSYFMRFIVTDSAPPTLAEVEAALLGEDAAFSILRDSASDEGGDLYHDDDLYGEIEVNLRGDPLCDEDLDEFIEELQKHDDPNREIALKALEEATGIVVLHVLRAGHENPAILNRLWEWMFETRSGLLQVDEEGFFDRDKRIVSLL